MTNSAKVIVIQLVVWYDFSVVDSDKSEFAEENCDEYKVGCG